MIRYTSQCLELILFSGLILIILLMIFLNLLDIYKLYKNKCWYIIIFCWWGYDSFLNHAYIWFHLKAKSISSYESNAVINKKVEIERIDHWPIKCGKKEEISMQKWKKNSFSVVIMEEWFRLACIWETKILEIINSNTRVTTKAFLKLNYMHL